MSFAQGTPSVNTLINSSNCIVLGNTSSGTALTVQQLGAGAVMNVATSTGSSALFVSSTGQVGVGVGSPQNTLDINGSQTIRNPTIYNTSSPGWYNIGLWVADAGGGGPSGQRLRLELIGGGGYDNGGDSQNQTGGVTTIYATILNNANTGRANCGGTFKHDGSAACCTQVKFVQNSTNRNQYYVYAYMSSYTQHGLRIDTTQGAYFTPSFTSTTDPGVNSATVQAAAFIGIFGYGSSAAVGIGTNNPSVTLTVAGGTGQILEMRPSSGGSCYGRIGNSVITDGSPNFLIFGADGGFPNGIAFLDTTQSGVAGTTPLAFRVNGSERMRITASGNVGIGTTNPTDTLNVVGSANVCSASGLFITTTTSGATSQVYAQVGFPNNGSSTNRDVLTLQQNNGGKARINIWGDVYNVGPQIDYGASLHRFMQNNMTTLIGGFSNGNLLTGGATTISVDANGYIIRGATSDQRLKSNIVPLTEYGLATVSNLNPVSFEWNDDAKVKFGDGLQYGLVAQDVQQVFPWAVSESRDEQKTLTIDYPKFTPVLINAIKELSAENTALKQSLATATARLDSLEARLAAAGL